MTKMKSQMRKKSPQEAMAAKEKAMVKATASPKRATVKETANPRKATIKVMQSLRKVTVVKVAVKATVIEKINRLKINLMRINQMMRDSLMNNLQRTLVKVVVKESRKKAVTRINHKMILNSRAVMKAAVKISQRKEETLSPKNPMRENDDRTPQKLTVGL